MKRIALALCAVLGLGLCAALGLGVAAAAQEPFEPAIVVNDQVVTWWDLDQRMRLLAFNGAPQDERLVEIAADQLIEDRLRRAAAAAAGQIAGPSDIAAGVENFREQRGLSEAALDAGLARYGVREGTLEEALAADIEWRTVVRRRFGSRAEPSEAEIDQEIALGAAPREVRIAEIALPNAVRGEAETRRFAASLAAEMAAGGDFAAAARRHSSSPSAAGGGDVGWVPETALPPEAAGALAALPVGGVSEPIPYGPGVVILKLVDRRAVETGPVDRDEVRARLRSQRLGRFAATWLQELRAEAVIDRR